MSHQNQPVVACSECGELVQVSKAYFTGIDGRMLPVPEAHCKNCHEDAVRKSTKIQVPNKIIAVSRRTP